MKRNNSLLLALAAATMPVLALAAPTVDGTRSGGDGYLTALNAGAGVTTNTNFGFGTSAKVESINAALSSSDLYLFVEGSIHSGNRLFVLIDSDNNSATGVTNPGTGTYGETNGLAFFDSLPGGGGYDTVVVLEGQGSDPGTGLGLVVLGYDAAGAINQENYFGAGGTSIDFAPGGGTFRGAAGTVAVGYAPGDAADNGIEIRIPRSFLLSNPDGGSIKVAAITGNGANNFWSDSAIPQLAASGNIGFTNGPDQLRFSGASAPTFLVPNATYDGAGTYAVGPGGDYATLASFFKAVTGVYEGAGTITVASAGTVITGTGTDFIADGVAAGDIILTSTGAFRGAKQAMTVVSVDSATQLTVSTGPTAVITALKYEIKKASAPPAVSGNITALVTGNITEPRNMSLAVNTGSNTFTIKPAPFTTPTVTFTRVEDQQGFTGHVIIGGLLSGANALIANTKNIVWDGSNTAGGTTRDMTLTNAAMATPATILVFTGDTDNAVVKNLNIINNSTSTSSGLYGIRFATVQFAAGVTDFNAQGYAAAGTYIPTAYQILNNRIRFTSASTAAQAFGHGATGTLAAGDAAAGFSISDNDIHGGCRGIFLDGGSMGDILRNKIYVQGAAGVDTYGILLNNARTPATGTANYSNNSIVLGAVDTTGKTVTGIAVTSAGTTINTYKVNNNTIVSSHSVANTAAATYRGIRESSAVTFEAIHNSIYIPDGPTAVATVGNVIGIGGFAAAGAIANVRNNNIVITETTGIGIDVPTAIAPTTNFVCNNNNIVAPNIGRWAATAYTSLGTWQASPATPDLNSGSLDPAASWSTSDLHFISSPSASLLSGFSSAVTADIDGQTRAGTPVFGADEYVANTAPTGISQVSGFSSGSVTINENTALNTVLGVVKGIDADPNDVGAVTLSDNAGGRFSIRRAGPAEYQIRVASASLLDYEAATSHNLTALFTDRAGATTSQVLTVNLLNVNEAPTSVNLSANTIAENAGVVIGTLSAVDPDAGGSHTFALTGADAAAFQITGGNQLELLAAANFEAKASYAISVTATDQASLASPAVPLTITVTDVNEAPTDIALTNATINEGVGNVAVGTLSATDVDAGATATFALVSGTGDTDNAKFSITGNALSSNGTIRTGSYSILVRATDNGTPGLTFDKIFAITVNDVADTDGDGISDAIEGSPNDALAGTASFVSTVGSQAVTLSSSAGTLSGVSSIATPGSEPGGTTFPIGLVDFSITGLTNGQTVTVTISYPSNASINKAYKVAGTTYTEIAGATVGATSISYSITDGGAGDADATANGVIDDPAGPAVFVSAVGDWTLLND